MCRLSSNHLTIIVDKLKRKSDDKIELLHRRQADNRAVANPAAITAPATNANVDITAGDTSADKFLIFNTLRIFVTKVTFEKKNRCYRAVSLLICQLINAFKRCVLPLNTFSEGVIGGNIYMGVRRRRHYRGGNCNDAIVGLPSARGVG